MNFDPILHDFNVQLLCENPGQCLYGKAETLYFHFILVRKSDGREYQTMSQYFFPRLGFSLAMLAHHPFPKNPVAGFKKKDLFPEYLEGYNPAGLETENGPEFFLDFGNGPLSLGLKSRNSVTSAILNDGTWFKKFAATRESVSARAFIDAHSRPKGVESSENLLKMAEKLHVLPDLEYELSKGVRRGNIKQEGFLDLVLNARVAKPEIPEDILDYWMSTLSTYGQQNSCECGNAYCFFEIAKKMQLKYFPDTYDNPEAVKAFWKKLPPAQKAILIIMNDVVGLTPLVAQDIFEEDFDIGYLSEMLSQGNQPDDAWDLQVRKFVSLADYLWKKSNFENDRGRN